MRARLDAAGLVSREKLSRPVSQKWIAMGKIIAARPTGSKRPNRRKTGDSGALRN
jgi:hypothetical protein